MDTNFRILSNFSVENTDKLKDNYYLKINKTKTNEYDFELKNTSMPSFIKNIFLGLINLFSPNKYVYSNNLIALLHIAANPNEKNLPKEYKQISTNDDLYQLSQNPDLQQMARVIQGMETEKTKLQRALKKVATVVKGLGRMKRQQMQGKILSPDYMIEIGKEHFYDVDHYLQQWGTSETHLNFDDWMKWNHPTAKVQKVKYLNNDQERAPYKLNFKDGQVFRNNVLFNTTSEKMKHIGQEDAIFVIDANGQFYAGSHTIGKFHHSSFLGGAAIMGAGEIQTNKEGRIIGLSNKSGHYQPSKEQIFNTLKVLEKAGIDLSTVKFTEHTDKGLLVYHSAKLYLETKGTCPLNGYEGFEIEATPNGDYILILTDKTLPRTERFKEVETAVRILKSKFDINCSKYKDILFSDQRVEYPMDAYLQNEGKIAPTSWEGGRLEFENGLLKKIIIDSQAAQTNPKDADLYFLQLLKRAGIDLSSIEIDNNGKTLNAKKYFEDSMNAES